ncbi:hypothetical protein E1295_16005 [Nonomuraea mesophila]|uniref:Uncharacterized protein n=1 Tax=Nonomuraea mesophila TaxID=2530382 RepID=A0A4R5FM95_9ACTN|nr:hypothetical protein [Nonomuraea mesophila]TDE54004.1 hypothetical protein E1295_16005 [Nonomuraea mesophila]
MKRVVISVAVVTSLTQLTGPAQTAPGRTPTSDAVRGTIRTDELVKVSDPFVAHFGQRRATVLLPREGDVVEQEELGDEVPYRLPGWAS